MINLVDAFACGIVVIAELIGVILLALLIQLVVYQLTGISLYVELGKWLDKLEKKLNKIF